MQCIMRFTVVAQCAFGPKTSARPLPLQPEAVMTIFSMPCSEPSLSPSRLTSSASMPLALTSSGSFMFTTLMHLNGPHSFLQTPLSILQSTSQHSTSCLSTFSNLRCAGGLNQGSACISNPSFCKSSVRFASFEASSWISSGVPRAASPGCFLASSRASQSWPRRLFRLSALGCSKATGTDLLALKLASSVSITRTWASIRERHDDAKLIAHG
mmetsp:Transcript_78016/g.137475  ORF Transcript_78016/g.137475 Transcript_78016/m.137475 type:complete len:213 (-) Transcript_78016:9-647(-)